MTIKNFTFFSPSGTEFPVGSNNDGKLYMMLTGMDYGTIRRKDWTSPLNTALNVQYTNTSIVAGGRYFELLNETVALKANSVNYIHANIDLSQTSSPVSLSAETVDNSNKVDLNNNSGVLKVLIDIRTTNAMGVIKSEIPKLVTTLDEIFSFMGVLYPQLPKTPAGVRFLDDIGNEYTAIVFKTEQVQDYILINTDVNDETYQGWKGTTALNLFPVMDFERYRTRIIKKGQMELINLTKAEFKIKRKADFV